MNNKGFVFIETIITAVILLSALLLLYNSYSNVIRSERKKLYNDDITFIFKTISIRDIFKREVNITKFNEAVDKNRDCNASTGVGSSMCKYIYFFNVDSPIFNTNDDMKKTREFLNFYQLAYIKLSDIKNIKNCINGTTDDLCNNTLNYIKGYSYTNFQDYLKTIDVESATVNGHSGILISIFFLTKSGANINDTLTDVAFGKYEKCIQDKVYDFYMENYYHSTLTDDQKEEAMTDYEKNKDLNFSVQCSYAYYYSWVYL